MLSDLTLMVLSSLICFSMSGSFSRKRLTKSRSRVSFHTPYCSAVAIRPTSTALMLYRHASPGQRISHRPLEISWSTYNPMHSSQNWCEQGEML